MSSRIRSGGRPPDPAKDEAIIAAARDMFFAHGFAATTIEQVAAHAGVSKVTIYKRYEDKIALFEALVRNEMIKMQEAFDAWPYVDGSLAERLNAFGCILLRFLFSQEHMLLDRMLAHDLRHSPDATRRFFEAGPGACRQRIATMLADAADAGEIVIDDPLLAASDVFALWTGFMQKELDFLVRAPLTEAEVDERVARGTRLFLRATSYDHQRAVDTTSNTDVINEKQ